ncbi:hypothetical protein [Xanthomonas axonopodis]|uniref:Uncharacterized protein n=1 Tax=Xanthomonas axonopodis pv. vasculorum TaxID=325777 RepID=A0A098PUL8_9XANT|nr:hypothetical protein [Xanthomonas axonopodis]KGE50396.1 hypothetical protein GW15_0221830 [Xanthomonas axonopodis pv. vasculorum]
MSKTKISVSGLAHLLAQLLGYDIYTLSRAANIPRANVASWLGGNIRGLRVNTIVELMGMLGLRLDAGAWRLDSQRVHFWRVKLGAFTKVEDALAAVELLSRLLGANSAITQVHPPKAVRGRSGLARTDQYMIGGGRCRVVVSVTQPFFRKVRVTPDVAKGTMWRDDNRHHTMQIQASHWRQVLARDMTVKEFDQAFEQSMGAMDWGDLALAARQFNLTPEDLLGWVRERYEPDMGSQAAADDIEVAGSQNVILLGRDIAPRRTGSYG